MMKFRTEKRSRTGSLTIDGITNPTTETYDVKVPVIPRDWDQVAVKGATSLVLALTAISIVWSTVSIGSLLGGGVGFAAAALFDLAWIIGILLEWLSRFDQEKRKFPKGMGWALLFVTMGAIAWHGLVDGINAHSIALAVVGATVSLVAKVLWMGIMKHINRDLSPEHQQWVDAERSKANAQLALATVRRQVARADARASMELLAAERTRSEFEELLPAAASSAPVLDASTVTALPTNRIPRTSTDDAMTSRAHDATVRPNTSGYPESTAPDQATDATNIRQKNGKRPSIAKEVRRVVADGLTDVETIAHAVAHRVGRDADDPTYTETVKHYVREARKDQEKDSSRGLYL